MLTSARFSMAWATSRRFLPGFLDLWDNGIIFPFAGDFHLEVKFGAAYDCKELRTSCIFICRISRAPGIVSFPLSCNKNPEQRNVDPSLGATERLTSSNLKSEDGFYKIFQRCFLHTYYNFDYQIDIITLYWNTTCQLNHSAYFKRLALNLGNVSFSVSSTVRQDCYLLHGLFLRIWKGKTVRY